MIKELIQRYWRLAVFADTPEHTPYSPMLMAFAALMFSILIILQWQLGEPKALFSFYTSIFAAISLILSYWIYSYVLLKIHRHTGRLIQTLTCLWFCHFIIHLIALPLFLLAPFLASADMKNPIYLMIGVLYLFVTLGLSIWQFLITAHIYRFALNISSFQSLLASIGLLALNILTVSLWR